MAHIKGGSDSRQLRPCFKLELLLKERICSQRERILSFKSSSLIKWKITFATSVTSLECYYFITHVRNCANENYVNVPADYTNSTKTLIQFDTLIHCKVQTVFASILCNVFQ